MAKLKVFRTPIGFHDAYVAAPSQKAALEAWGAESNLFAQGAAEQVEDAALTKAALARPGEVIKVLRGSAEEQLAALGAAESKAAKPSPQPSRPRASGRRNPPEPSRDALDAAEAELKRIETDQRAEQRRLAREEEALARRRREMARRHEAERDEAAERLEREQGRFDRAMGKWKKGAD